jgi:hypothetical protein
MVAESVETLAIDGIETPWGPQTKFLQSPALFRRYQGGQGSGKTLAGVWQIRRWAKLLDNAVFIATEPTYPMVRDILIPEFERQWKEAEEEHLVEWRASSMKYVLANGSEIWLRQCEKFDSLRGPSVAGVLMDEGAQSPHKAFQILCGRMRQRGFPHLFMVTGTPRGENWMHWTFTPGERPDGAPLFIGDALKDYIGEDVVHDGPFAESFFAESLKNPYLDPVTKATLQSAYTPGTPLYRQEVLGETTVFEGLIYTEFKEMHHVCEAPGPRAFERYVIAQDWGWTNPGCQLLIGIDKQDVAWVLEEVYEPKRMVGWWADQAKEQSKHYEVTSVVCDPSEPDNIAEFRRRGLPAVGADNSVIPGITAVGGRFGSDRLFVTPGCVNLISELKSYQWKIRRTGGYEEIKNDEPNQVNDHAADCLRYGVMKLRTTDQEQGSGGTSAPTGKHAKRRQKRGRQRSYFD